MTNRRSPTPMPHEEDGFAPILDFVREARAHALASVNRESVSLYWRIGDYLSRKIATDGWGQGTVQRLADWLAAQESGIRGYSPQNLWRMRQFCETYREDGKLSPMLREIQPDAESAFKDGYLLEKGNRSTRTLGLTSRG